MLDWLYTAISWVMARWHTLWDFVFGDPPPESGLAGLAWALSIVCLVVTIRLLLFPLFVKQIKSQRAMQELQPEMAKLRKQYGSDRQGLSQAMMALQKERGVNPLAGCLPVLPQIPVFLALFHVLRRLAPGAEGLYGWSDELTDEAARAKLFGAPISASFNMAGAKEAAILEIADYTTIRIVAFVLIVIMCCTTFFTQKQIMARSGPVEGQAATVQKLMLYGMPLSLFVSGFFFPIGVLLYWFTNNLWTLGQQFFILAQDAAARLGRRQGQGRRRQARGRPAHPRAQAGGQAGPHEAGPPRDPAGRLDHVDGHGHADRHGRYRTTSRRPPRARPTDGLRAVSPADRRGPASPRPPRASASAAERRAGVADAHQTTGSARFARTELGGTP